MTSIKGFSFVERLAGWLRALLTYRSALIFLLLFAIPIIMYGAQKSWLHTENRVEDWIPAKFVETENLQKFQAVFGLDEIMFVSWDGCTMDSPQLQAFKEKLLGKLPVRDGTSQILFHQVITGKDAFDRLSHVDFQLSPEEIRNRLQGYLLSRDQQETCLIALISEEGRKFRQDAVKSVWLIADSIDGLGRDKIHIGGSTTDSVSIDEISRSHTIEMNMISYVIGILISYFCFQHIRPALLVFSISFLNQQICLAMIYYLNVPFDSVLMLAANLTFVLSMSAGIHLVNYYREAIRYLPPEEAVFKALSTALVPTFISVVTTVAGLLSFMSSQLVPISKFGSLSSRALLISMVVLLIYIPLHFLMFPMQGWRKKEEEGKDAEANPNSGDEEEAPGLLARTIEALFFPLVRRFPYGVICVSVVLAAVGLYGATHLKTSIGLHSMLRSDTRPIKDYQWIEEKFGPLIPVEIMIAYPEGDGLEIFQRLQTMKTLTAKLQEKLPDTGVLSLLNFVQDLPDGSSSSDVAARRVYRRRIAAHRDALSQSGFFVEKDGKQYWRVTVRVYAMKKLDYGPILVTLNEVVRSVLDEEAKVSLTVNEKDAAQNALAPASFLVTGGVPLVYRAQQQLLEDLKTSFMTAFFIIALILVVLFRSVRCGIFAVFPSVLPCIIIFGLVGLLRIRVELGTMLTGSAALGIAVDNAVHYITWFRIGSFRGLSRLEAVRMAYRKCGVAMFQTAAVCSFGLVAYTISPFIPIIYFSFFMFALLMTALLSDLTVLPALLISPAGKLFLRDMPVADADHPAEEADVYEQRSVESGAAAPAATERS